MASWVNKVGCISVTGWINFSLKVRLTLLMPYSLGLSWQTSGDKLHTILSLCVSCRLLQQTTLRTMNHAVRPACYGYDGIRGRIALNQQTDSRCLRQNILALTIPPLSSFWKWRARHPRPNARPWIMCGWSSQLGFFEFSEGENWNLKGEVNLICIIMILPPR